jgi:aminoglycoside 6'-N-acetyltransferase I
MRLQVRRYQDSDWAEWLRMSLALFDDCTEAELAKGMREFRARSDGEVFVVDRADGSLAGFVEAGSRPYAEGCDTTPVGYVEAWYVDDDFRRQGYGRARLDAADDWARRQGYREMASDALLDNDTSHRAHKASGYTEVERIVTFRKAL